MEIATRRREQEVWQACDDLWALHGEIGGLTGDAIRDRLLHLGRSRGSPNELYKYRKTWIKSRGLNFAALPAIPDGELDPISRAVKLVHEQLKTEALEETHRLRQEFEEKLKDKDDELAKSKNALDAVVAEFNEVHHRYSENTASLDALKAQCIAETEVRKAAERELISHRALFEQQLAAHETLVNEIKALHIHELTNLESVHKAQAQQQNALIEKLLLEKKQLGAEFSDKLNEIRTISYNQDVKIKVLESRLLDSHGESNKLSNALMEKGKEVGALKESQAHIIEALQGKVLEIALLKAKIKEKALENKQLNNTVKKSQITIARLRAISSYGAR